MTTYTAVLVTPGSRVYLPKFTSINGAFEKMRDKWDQPFLPVAIWPVEVDKFCRVAGLIKLPYWKSIEWAAVRFFTMPIVSEWSDEFIRHLRNSNIDDMRPLFADWERAVNAKGVAPA